MSYIEENIYNNLSSTLGAITSAAGYENTVGTDSVFRWAQPPNEEDVDFSKFPAFIIINGPEEVLFEKPYLRRSIRPRIRGYISDRITPSSSVNSLKGDLIKALYADVTRGGNAYATWVRGSTALDDLEKPYAGFELIVEIRFETTTSSP